MDTKEADREILQLLLVFGQENDETEREEQSAA